MRQALEILNSMPLDIQILIKAHKEEYAGEEPDNTVIDALRDYGIKSKIWNYNKQFTNTIFCDRCGEFI